MLYNQLFNLEWLDKLTFHFILVKELGSIIYAILFVFVTSSSCDSIPLFCCFACNFLRANVSLFFFHFIDLVNFLLVRFVLKAESMNLEIFKLPKSYPDNSKRLNAKIS